MSQTSAIEEPSAAPLTSMGTQLMGILNVTPDSFSDGGELLQRDAVVARAQAHVAAGASWLDVGAESTRPNATPVTPEEEWARLEPALRALTAAQLPVRISVDTRRAVVAQKALNLGAHAINDVSALQDPLMGPLVASAQVPIVLMHWAGPSPTGGHHHVHYENVVEQVCAELLLARDRSLDAGIRPENIWLDPGVGFGKNHQHALTLTKHLQRLVALGHPVVYGPSRKRFLQQIVGKPSQQCDAATAAICCVAAMKGAQIVRVHDPQAVRDAMQVGSALRLA